jgi:hypothetical protein
MTEGVVLLVRRLQRDKNRPVDIAAPDTSGGTAETELMTVEPMEPRYIHENRKNGRGHTTQGSNGARAADVISPSVPRAGLFSDTGRPGALTFQHSPARIKLGRRRPWLSQLFRLRPRLFVHLSVQRGLRIM